MVHHATSSLEIVTFDAPMPYDEVYARQLEVRDSVRQGKSPSTLFLLEHTPVFTLGRNAQEDHLLQSRAQLSKLGIDVVEVDRGGDVTYHGPGQLVAYPVLDLRHWQCSVSWYLRTLEDVIIDSLAQLGLPGERSKGFTGVWVRGAKVAAVGIGIRDWISYHGISINVAPNMDHWRMIVPCGIPDKPVTSIKLLLDQPCPSTTDVARIFERAFRQTFGFA